MALWGQNTNLMELNYSSYSTARYNFKGKDISDSGTQCHPPMTPIIKMLSSTLDMPQY